MIPVVLQWHQLQRRQHYHHQQQPPPNNMPNPVMPRINTATPLHTKANINNNNNSNMHNLNFKTRSIITHTWNGTSGNLGGAVDAVQFGWSNSLSGIGKGSGGVEIDLDLDF